MIYNDEFVWLHFPKCAGTKTERLFQKYFSMDTTIHQDIVDPKNDKTYKWHDTIVQREARDKSFKLGDRTIIFPFRKLPNWLISRYNFGYHENPNLPYKTELLLEGKFLWSNGQEGNANNLLTNFLPPALLIANRIEFIRTEFFEDDFKTIFSKYLDISIIPDWEYQKKSNASQSYLSDEMIDMIFLNQKSIYNKSPYWKFLESAIYTEDTYNAE
jgi:hypothetical protein